MLNDVAIFWAVLAGFLVFDNLVLLPADKDYLRVGWSGRLRYEPAVRFKARQRDLVLLNPLNPFDRLAVASKVAGALSPAMFRRAIRLMRGLLPTINFLSALGSAYLAVLLACAAASLALYIGDVLLCLLFAHLWFWVLGLVILVRRRSRLHLSVQQTAALAVEAFLVPAYLVNLSKRVLLRQAFDVPALAIGLRQLKLMGTDPGRELYLLELANRVKEVAIDLGLDDEDAADGAEPGTANSASKARGAWLAHARQCIERAQAAP